MRHYQLHVVTLLLALAAAIETQTTSTPEGCGIKRREPYLFLEIKPPKPNTNGTIRAMRNAVSMGNKDKRLQIDSDVRVVTHCNTSRCAVKAEGLSGVCRDSELSKIVPPYYCKTLNNRPIYGEWEYGQFFHRIKPIYGVKAKKYLCLAKTGDLIPSAKFHRSCLFVFWPLDECRQCDSSLTEDECVLHTHKFSPNRVVIFSLAYPNLFHPEKLNQSNHGAICQIRRLAPSMEPTLTFNNRTRWFVGVSDDRLQRVNETDPLHYDAHWHAALSDPLLPNVVRPNTSVMPAEITPKPAEISTRPTNINNLPTTTTATTIDSTTTTVTTRRPTRGPRGQGQGRDRKRLRTTTIGPSGNRRKPKPVIQFGGFNKLNHTDDFQRTLGARNSTQLRNEGLLANKFGGSRRRTNITTVI